MVDEAKSAAPDHAASEDAGSLSLSLLNLTFVKKASAAVSGGRRTGAERRGGLRCSVVSFFGLSLCRFCDAQRMQADSLSKILFQFHARHDKIITIQQIAQQLQQQQQQMQTQQPSVPQQLQSSSAPAATSSFVATSLAFSPAAPTAPKSDMEGDTHMG